MKEFTAENQERLNELTRGKATHGLKNFLLGLVIGVPVWMVISFVLYRILIKG